MLIYYPGHLGDSPVTQLKGGRAIRWSIGKVAEIADGAGRSLVRDGGFREALALSAAAKKAEVEPSALTKELAALGVEPIHFEGDSYVVLPLPKIKSRADMAQRYTDLVGSPPPPNIKAETLAKRIRDLEAENE